MATEAINQIKRGIQAACDKQRISIVDAALKAEVAPSTMYRFVSGGNITIATLLTFINVGLGLKLETLLRMGK